MNSILTGIRKLVEFELAHPAIWLHRKQYDDCYYRIPPVSFRFSFDHTHLLKEDANWTDSTTILLSLHDHLSNLLEFLIQKHSNAIGNNLRGEIGSSGCTASGYQQELIAQNIFSFIFRRMASPWTIPSK